MNVKSIIASLSGYVSPNKIDASLSRSEQRPSNREIKKRTVMVLVGGGAEPFTGSIADRIDAMGIDLSVWMVESLNPVVALSAELKPGLLNLPALATTCKKHNCRFVAASGTMEFGIVGGGTRMSYGSVTPLWSRLISAALQLHGSDSWVSGELWTEIYLQEVELRDVDGTKFYRIARAGEGVMC